MTRRSHLIILFSAVVVASVSVAQVEAPNQQESRARAKQLFPELSDPDSPLQLAISAEQTLRRSEPEFFNDPNWPLFLALRVTQKLGIKPTAGSPRKEAAVSTANPTIGANDDSAIVHAIILIEGNAAAGTGFLVSLGSNHFVATNAHVIFVDLECKTI